MGGEGWGGRTTHARTAKPVVDDCKNKWNYRLILELRRKYTVDEATGTSLAALHNTGRGAAACCPALRMAPCSSLTPSPLSSPPLARSRRLFTTGKACTVAQASPKQQGELQASGLRALV